MVLIVNERDRAGLEANLAMQQELGIDVRPVSAQVLADIDPNARLAEDEIAAFEAEAGSLDNARIVKVTGYVASAAGFNRQPEVINGASDFLSEVFGERGTHARSAVGVSELPLDAPVEVELIVEVTLGS
jgi:enamine deaminase RidA (YjgF/YER057c/UK114 family)